MRPNLIVSEILERYEDEVRHYCTFTCWLTIEYGEDFTSFLDITSGHLDKFRRLSAYLKGVEQILGLDRAYIEHLALQTRYHAVA